MGCRHQVRATRVEWSQRGLDPAAASHPGEAACDLRLRHDFTLAREHRTAAISPILMFVEYDVRIRAATIFVGDRVMAWS